MKKTVQRLVLLILPTAALVCASAVRADTKTFGVASGAWNLAANWSPAGIPASGDDVIVPAGSTVTGLGVAESCASLSVGGLLTLNGFNFTVSGGTVISNGGTILLNSTGGTRSWGDIFVDTGGYFNGAENGNIGTISGNITNNGSWNAASAGQSTIFTLTGANKVIAGSGVFTNQTVTVNGTYTILPGVVFLTGGNNTGSSHLNGSGALTNQGFIYYHCSATPGPECAFDSSAAGSTFVWTNVNATLNFHAAPYFNIIAANQGSSGVGMSAVTSIGGDVTVLGTGNVASWPGTGVIGGTFTYATSSGTVSPFPATFSIGGFVQSSGSLSLPANAVLTVTGSGANAWNRTGGTFAPGAGSTVKFTGGSPGLGGTVTNRFCNLIIDTTATNAAVSTSLFVSNALTIAAGASLDVTTLAPYTLSVTQSVFGSGTIKGDVSTAANSKAKIFGGTDGTFGTLTVSGNLTLGTSNTVNLDIDTTAAAAHDKVVVGATFTANGTIFNLKAPSAGASLDTTTDYVLATAASGISGTPVLNWVVPPVDPADYSLVVSGNSINLHFGGVVVPPTNPKLSAVLSGSSVTLSWDTNTFPGFNLQAQTNAAGISTTGWSDLSAADASPFPATVDPQNPIVFYRLIHP